MARYELSLSPTYVKHWTFVEAVREIFQNAIDQQTTNPDNLMAYDHEEVELKIYSLKSGLDRSSLLMGNTTKDGDVNQIGSFGEGYKLALLVLARDGFSVEIHNYAKKEIWRPKIVKSRRYQSDLLVIDIEKWYVKDPPDSDLTFIISGITDDHFEEIRNNILFLQSDIERINTERGDILLGDDQQGKIYVNGLFVEKLKGNILFGYDMKAKSITLDRDRRAVNAFQLTWDTSYMWSKVAKEYPDLFRDLLAAESIDIQYINSSGESIPEVAADIAYDDFKSKYGSKAIPVSNQYDKDQVYKTYPKANIIITTPIIADLINKSDKYQVAIKAIDKVEKLSPNRVLEIFYENYQSEFSKDMAIHFESILEESQGWAP